MKIVYKCSECGLEFDNREDCNTHEAEHDFNFDMAFKILKQTDLDKEYAACEKCPRESPHCDGCRNRARDIVLNAIDNLPEEVKRTLFNEKGDK